MKNLAVITALSGSLLGTLALPVSRPHVAVAAQQSVATADTTQDVPQSRASFSTPQASSPKDGPREFPDDPPATPSQLSRRASSPAAIVTVGPYTSVQVNVDAFDNNIVGDAANEPSIAIDPTDPDRIVIGWRQFDTILSNFRQAGWAYSHDAGQTWTFPGVIEPGQFRSDPVLGADTNGNFFYSSLSSGTSAEMFTSINGGVTWLPQINAFGGDKQWITVDQTAGIGSGHIYEIWNVQFSCCGTADFARSIDGGSSFEAAIAVPEPSMKWGTLAVGPEGELYAAGATLGGAGHLIARSTNAQNPALAPTFDFVNTVNLGGATRSGAGPNPGGLLGQVWVAVDHSNGSTRGNVYILGSVDPPGDDPLDVHFVRSTDGGLTWSSPVRVNDDPTDNGAWQWFGTMSVAPNGRIDVIFNDTRNSGQAAISETFYAFSTDAGVTWSPNVPVTPAFNSYHGWPQQNKMGDYYHMISDDGGANLAYAATFNAGLGGEGEEDVYFLRIPQDCNNNDVEDPTDIDVGTSEDCNENRIPDECEPDEDCNENTFQDICDIADGTSADCNSNRVPDECEPDEDCNDNTFQDICDIADGTSGDCNENTIPDECDIASATSDDDNLDGVPDECQGACCRCGTCVDTVPSDCTDVGWEYAGVGTLCPGETCPGLPNDECNARESLPLTVDQVVPFDNRCATDDGPTPVTCDNGLQAFGSDIWYEFVSPCSADMTVSLCDNTNMDTILAVYGDGGSTCSCPFNENSLLACGDDTCRIGGGPSTVTVPAQAGACYTIRVAGWAGTKGTGEMRVLVECEECIPTTTTDCNENGLPDECDIFYTTSSDCNGNAVPDECDIAEGTSPDVNGSGVPDECEIVVPPAPAASPHDARKNRYVSIDGTANAETPVAYQVRLASMRRCSGDLRRACVVDADCPGVCTLNHDLQCEDDPICGGDGPCVPASPCVEHPDVGAVSRWLDQPFESTCLPLHDCSGQRFAHLRSAPLFRVWTEETLHITGCEIVPAANYDVHSSVDGIVFSSPLTTGTIAKPNVHYGDCVGPVVGGAYSPPDGHTNVTDVQAFLAAQTGTGNPPHTTWVDLNAGVIPVVPQQILNVGDLQTIKAGFIGKTYVETPGHEDPGDCP